jgi:type I restriction enzyme, S subunit
MSELPPGWVWTSIGEVMGAGLFSDGDWVESKDQDPDGEVRLVQLADVGEGEFRDRSNRHLTSESARALGCTYLAPGDVLVARMPHPLGRACRMPQLAGLAVTAVDICILRPTAVGVDSSWLMWAVNAPQARSQIAELQSGTTRKRISKKNLATVRIAVPPRREQERVVAAIEEHLSRLDAAEAGMRSAEIRLQSMRASILKAVTTGGWERRPLGEVLLSLRNGCFVSRPKADPPGLPILRISAVRPLALDVTDVRYAPESLDRSAEYEVRSGDLLFTRYSGNPEYVGACATVPPEGAGLLHPDKLIRGVPDPSLALSSWIALVVSAADGRRQIEQRLKTTAGQVGIAGSQLKTVPIPLPPLDEQADRLRHWESGLDAMVRVRSEIESCAKRSERVRRSILAAAFAGQLVPQDPRDEPASALLDRIKSERQAATPIKRTRKAKPS